MKAMPLAFEEFQGKGALDFSSSSSSSDSFLSPAKHQQQHENWLIVDGSGDKKEDGSYCYVGSEPTSVLDARRSPSPPTSSSTLSSSLGGNNSGGGGGSGGGSTDTTDLAPLPNVSSSLDNAEKCGLGLMEDWETVLSGSPSQEQSILRLIMGDVDDPSVGLNKILQPGNGSPQDFDFNSNFGVIDQASLGFEPLGNNIDPSSLHGSVSNPTHVFPSSTAANISPVSLPPSVFQQHLPNVEDEKPQIFNPQLIINQNQAQFTQNPAFFVPLPYAQSQEHHLLSPPPPKRVNYGPPGNPFQKLPFSDSGQNELFLRRQQQQHQEIQMLQQRQQPMGVPSPATATVPVTKQKMVSDEMANQQLQQAIIDQIFKAAELIETGNSVLAQGILARLNHQLFSPIGKPFQRAAFYFKEALQLLLHSSSNSNPNPNLNPLSNYSIIFKIGAYKSFSEISPILQFANFTCNQAFLESFDGFDRIHIVDFDIGYGGQWASLMQELVLRNEGPPSLKITAFASPSGSEELEFGFTQENLKHFANELNIPFEIDILSLESLNSGNWPLPIQRSENEVIAVNLPIGSFSNSPSTLPMVLRFIKQLLPKIVVSLDRGSDRADVPFPHHIIHAFQSYTGLLESLEAVNVNLDALQKIERFLIHPWIEKIVLGRQRCHERLPPWKGLFMQSGFSPLTFSNFAESQAECLVQRTPVRGFHVEKRQSSLVLCWQRKELISVTAWRC